MCIQNSEKIHVNLQAFLLVRGYMMHVQLSFIWRSPITNQGLYNIVRTGQNSWK